MKRARQEEGQTVEKMSNLINVATVGAFAPEWTDNPGGETEEVVRRIYLVNGVQPHVKFVIDSNANWRYVDFLGKNWSIIQHERVVDCWISGRDGKWQGSTPEIHRSLLGDIADLRSLMQNYHVTGHDSIQIVKSIIPFEVISFKIGLNQ